MCVSVSVSVFPICLGAVTSTVLAYTYCAFEYQMSEVLFPSYYMHMYVNNCEYIASVHCGARREKQNWSVYVCIHYWAHKERLNAFVCV